MARNPTFRHVDGKLYDGKLDARGRGEHELMCGHVTRGNVVVTAPGSNRRNDMYYCPQGCGLQRRRR